MNGEGKWTNWIKTDLIMKEWLENGPMNEEWVCSVYKNIISMNKTIMDEFTFSLHSWK